MFNAYSSREADDGSEGLVTVLTVRTMMRMVGLIWKTPTATVRSSALRLAFTMRIKMALLTMRVMMVKTTMGMVKRCI